MQRYWLPNGENLGPMQLSHISGLNCEMHMLWEITIGNGLLRENVEPPVLTAALEAGIAVVFEHLRHSVEFEIDEPEAGTY
jgi:hypothetical protein